jgi:SAM-dependent methyltransferase
MMREKNSGIGPSGYHQYYYSDRDWQAYSALLARVVNYSKPGPILDLGAGCGYFVEAAGKWGFLSIGLEGSIEAVDMAKKRVPDIDIKLHKLSDEFPFKVNSFQTVVLNQVIEHLEPEIMRLALLEAYRVLRPSGMLLITSPSCYNKAELRADPTHINLLSPTQLHNILMETGFEKVKSFDAPLPLLGRGRIGFGMANAIFKLLRTERISATANAMAFKPAVKC